MRSNRNEKGKEKGNPNQGWKEMNPNGLNYKAAILR